MILCLGSSSARKRRRVSENVDIEDRLESLITRVGEKVNKNKTKINQKAQLKSI